MCKHYRAQQTEALHMTSHCTLKATTYDSTCTTILSATRVTAILKAENLEPLSMDTYSRVQQKN